MQELWFYAGAGRKATGPCSREQMLALRAKGEVWSDTLVWKAGTDAWIPLADSALADEPVPPPLPLRVEAAPAVPGSGPGSVREPEAEPARERLVEARVDASARAGDDGVPEAAELPMSTTGAGQPEAFEVDYGVPSPRSFRSGGERRAIVAGEPPAQPVDDDGWQYAKPVMWRRYFARMLDTIVLGSLIWFALATLLAAFIPGAYQALYGHVSLLNNSVTRAFLTFVVVIPVEAWILGMTGTTAGKWLFGVRVTHADGRAIGFVRALRREGRVFLQGLALGIPLFSMIAMIIAFVRVKDDGVAGWDTGKPWLVTARPPGAAQTSLFIVGVVFVIAAFAGLQVLVAASKA